MFLFLRDFTFASALHLQGEEIMFVTKLSSLAFPRNNGQGPGKEFCTDC